MESRRRAVTEVEPGDEEDSEAFLLQPELVREPRRINKEEEDDDEECEDDGGMAKQTNSDKRLGPTTITTQYDERQQLAGSMREVWIGGAVRCLPWRFAIQYWIYSNS